MNIEPERELLEQAAKRIEAAQENAASDKKLAPDVSGARKAGQLGLEFVGACLFCFLIGYAADHYAGTTPIGSMIGLCLGFFTGAYNGWRQLQGFGAGIGFKKPEFQRPDPQNTPKPDPAIKS